MGETKTSIPGIFFPCGWWGGHVLPHSVARVISVITGEHFFFSQLLPSKGIPIELLVLRPPSIETTPKCCIDKQSKTPAEWVEQAWIWKRQIFLKVFYQMLTDHLCNPAGNQPESRSCYASGRAGPSSAPHQRAESAFQGCWQQTENDRDRVEMSFPMTKSSPVWPTQ